MKVLVEIDNKENWINKLVTTIVVKRRFLEILKERNILGTDA